MNDYSQVRNDEEEVVSLFSAEIGGVRPSYRIKNRPDGNFLVFEFAEPTDRLYVALQKVICSLSDSSPYKDRVTISARSKKPADPLKTPEVALLQRELAASLTVDKNTFGSVFLSRYTPSVTNLESQVVINANHVVYGRRGAGKSSLLAYAMHDLRARRLPYVWLAMQTYAARSDAHAIASVVAELFEEIANLEEAQLERESFMELSEELLRLGELNDEIFVRGRLSKLTPRMRRMLAKITSPERALTMFLDDFHVLGRDLQPELLSYIYSLTRGNGIYLKLSGISQLTNLWDGKRKLGLESPHDVQTLVLDHNLTTPDQSKSHIKSILDQHARYCALPSVSYICSDEFLDRLVLSAAAVPRDALSLFSKSITRSVSKGQKSVSITSLNAATSEAIEEKLKDTEKDVSDGEKDGVQDCLSKVKAFCLVRQKRNAFLVRIENGLREYALVQKLIALRFVHVLHEGITPHKAGERYVALMLDYGFYIGIRAAKSVELFPKRPQQLPAKELRKLPIFALQ